MPIKMPNYTQIPNEILDKWMSQLSGSEFKIISAIARKTFGWKKRKDKISISQLAEITGLSNRSIIDALRVLNDKKLISMIGDERHIKSFEIIIEEEKSGEKSSPDETSCGEKSSPAGEKSSPDLAQSGEKSSHTKEISIKKLSQKKQVLKNEDEFKDTSIKNELFILTKNAFYSIYEELYKEKPDFTKTDFGMIKNCIKRAINSKAENPAEYIANKMEGLKDKCLKDMSKKFWIFTPNKLAYGWNQFIMPEKLTQEESDFWENIFKRGKNEK